ncbi:MAG: hypothetical protein H6505_02505 [Calditrichaeota bacterium]|nr:hypothetical protein [Calditrichota bacterium]
MWKSLALLLILAISSNASILSESEPNNTFAQANFMQCGDTVLCAHLDGHATDFFRFLLPAGDSVYIRTFSCGDDEDTFIVLYDSLFNLLAVDDNSGPGAFSTIAVFPTVTQMCYLQLFDPTGQSTGPYSLTLECTHVQSGPHDLCANARPITFFPYYDESTTFGAGSEGGTAAPDVFYRLSLATPADIFIQVCSEFFDARVQILLQCVSGYMDDASDGSCMQGADLYSYQLEARDYLIIVEGTSATQYGEFSIEVNPVFAECPAPDSLILFTVGDMPFLDWPDVPDASYYLIEGALSGEGPFEAITTTTQSFWQDNTGYAVPRRFYHVRSICQ